MRATVAAPGARARRRRGRAAAVTAGLFALSLAGCGDSAPPKPEPTAAKLGSWAEAGTLTVPRGGETLNTLADGTVLMAGGQLADAYTAVKAAEIFQPATGKWKTTADMSTNRNAHAATVLKDGKVLVTGGITSGGGPLATAEIYDPAAGSWTPAAAMSTARLNHTSTLLADGRVLVAGGFALVDSPGLASAELYDPATDSWAATAPMKGGRGIHTATVLADGRILVAAGNEVGSFRRTAAEATSTTVTNGLGSAAPNGKGEVATAELYDPATHAWATTGALKKGRSGHTATLLRDGKVLAVGGLSPDGELDSAEIYDPATGSWSTTTPLDGPRAVHTAALLPDGQVLVAGGHVGSSGSILSSALATSFLFDPSTAKWNRAADMGTPRTGHNTTVLADGRILVAGGLNPNGPVADAEVFSVKAKAGL